MVSFKSNKSHDELGQRLLYTTDPSQDLWRGLPDQLPPDDILLTPMFKRIKRAYSASKEQEEKEDETRRGQPN